MIFAHRTYTARRRFIGVSGSGCESPEASAAESCDHGEKDPCIKEIYRSEKPSY